MANYDECLKFIKNAAASLADSAHQDYKYMLLQLHAVYGLYYLDLHQSKLAFPYINSGIVLANDLNFLVWGSLCYASLGRYYSQTGDNDLATLYFKKGIASYKENVFPFGKAVIKNMYADFLFDTKNYPEAIVQAKDIYAIGEKTSNNYLKFIATGLLKRLYDANHNIDSAYEYSKIEYTWRDSTFNQEWLNKIQALNLTKK